MTTQAAEVRCVLSERQVSLGQVGRIRRQQRHIERGEGSGDIRHDAGAVLRRRRIDELNERNELARWAVRPVFVAMPEHEDGRYDQMNREQRDHDQNRNLAADPVRQERADCHAATTVGVNR